MGDVGVAEVYAAYILRGQMNTFVSFCVYNVLKLREGSRRMEC
jgi:hypothetical protein